MAATLTKEERVVLHRMLDYSRIGGDHWAFEKLWGLGLLKTTNSSVNSPTLRHYYIISDAGRAELLSLEDRCATVCSS